MLVTSMFSFSHFQNLSSSGLLRVKIVCLRIQQHLTFSPGIVSFNLHLRTYYSKTCIDHLQHCPKFLWRRNTYKKNAGKGESAHNLRVFSYTQTLYLQLTDDKTSFSRQCRLRSDCTECTVWSLIHTVHIFVVDYNWIFSIPSKWKYISSQWKTMIYFLVVKELICFLYFYDQVHKVFGESNHDFLRIG